MGDVISRLQAAKWLDHEHGVVFLREDWVDDANVPPLWIEPEMTPLKRIRRVHSEEYGKFSGYYLDGEQVCFFLWPERFPNLEHREKDVHVAGDFNSWNAGDPEWLLKPSHYKGRLCFVLKVARARVFLDFEEPRFKFVTEDGQWQRVPTDAPNREDDEPHNFILNPRQSGRHMFVFEPQEKHPILGHEKLVWKDEQVTESVRIAYGQLLGKSYSASRLGSFIENGKTIFRLFAPRAKEVSVTFFRNLAQPDFQTYPMTRIDECVWEKVWPKNLHGWYYHYSVNGDNVDNFSHFDPEFRILDPYALASVSRSGPGIILDQARLPKISKPFRPPHWHDLVIMEAHVRDLIECAPVGMSKLERSGFRGVAKWLRSSGCYLKQIGVNAVELQPIQENDSLERSAYHWGYMTCNFFAPASSYAQNPEEASQIEEFKDMVDAFHEQGIAVILDVVYNHVGEPAHLLYIDKEYYFEVDADGHLENWSGCGNDFKAHSPMGRRLIIDSLIHLVQTYDVDGFRFDLAELLGVDVLCDVEKALKQVKPGIILIAEPWSFRGHIAQALRHTGWSSWNDGYRDFAGQYVRGHGTRDTLKYFLSGSPHYFAMFPAQTINYTESHDDHCWLDRITENPDNNGSWPTLNDRRRTHLMLAMLMMSLGVPMLSAGQDFLRSKQGVKNTYQRGDLNALDYQRMQLYPMTHQYFRRWIQFRLSHQGRLLRLEHRQSEGYLSYYESGDTSALGVLYNADGSLGHERLLFAINPHHYPHELPVVGLNTRQFRQIADHERFEGRGLDEPCFAWSEGRIVLPPMSCGLWVSV